MNIVDAKIDWHHGFANEPTLDVYVDEDNINWSDIPHTWQKNGVIHAVVYPWVHYIFMGNGMVDPQNVPTRGFGGATFEFPLDDGTTIKSNDAWSSNPRHVEVPCVDVTVIVQDQPGYRMSCTLHLNEWMRWVSHAGAYVLADGRISADPHFYRKEGQEHDLQAASS